MGKKTEAGSWQQEEWPEDSEGPSQRAWPRNRSQHGPIDSHHHQKQRHTRTHAVMLHKASLSKALFFFPFRDCFKVCSCPFSPCRIDQYLNPQSCAEAVSLSNLPTGSSDLCLRGIINCNLSLAFCRK